MRLEWTEPVLDDLARLRAHISLDSPVYAEQFIGRIFEVAEKLIDFPRIGRGVPEAVDAPEEIREIIFRDYRIIYWLKSEAHIQVLAVIHGARDIVGAEAKPWG